MYTVKYITYNFVRKNYDLLFCWEGERKAEAVSLFPTNYNMRKYTTFLFQSYIILILDSGERILYNKIATRNNRARDGNRRKRSNCNSHYPRDYPTGSAAFNE